MRQTPVRDTMRRLRALALRFAGAFGAGRRHQDIVEELQAHRDMLTDEYRRSGLSDEDARRAAALAFGSMAGATGAYRDRRGLPRLENWWRDCRLAIRSSSRSPILFLSMVLVLGLGVGLSTAFATVLYAIIWRDLPVPEPEQVVKVAPQFSGRFSRHAMSRVSQFSLPELTEYRASTRALESLACMTQGRLTWRHDTDIRTLSAAFVTGDYFHALRVPATLGRVLAFSDAYQPVVVISHRLWIDSFGGRADTLGRSMALDRSLYTIVGVAPETFTGTDILPVDVWVPLEEATTLQGNASQLTETRLSWLEAIGRLAPDASVENARAEAALIATQLDASEPGRHTTIEVTRASRLDAGLLHSRESTGLIGAGTAAATMMAILLLICGSNAAALLLARGAGRQKEIALRVALGARRARVAQQLIAEVVLIAGASAIVGVLLCTGSLRALAAWLPLSELLDTLTPDRRVFGLAAAFAATVAALFGLAPIRQALQVDCLSNLKGDVSLFGARMPAARLRRGLVATQMAISAILLVIAALLSRGVERTFSIDPGYSTQRLYVVEPDASLRPNTAVSTNAGSLVSQTRDALTRAPGIDVVGLARLAPFRGAGFTSTKDETTGTFVTLYNNEVDAQYFRALGVSPIAGRLFRSDEAGVVMVNFSLARKFFGSDAAAVDHELRIPGQGYGAPRTVTIVGVIPAIQTFVPGVPDDPAYYLPLNRNNLGSAFLIVKAREGAGAPVARLAVDAVRAVDATAVTQVTSFDERMSAATALARAGAAIAGLVGILALLVAAVGIHGIIAHAVISRTREIGVHLALGAPRVSILRLILGWTMRGVAIGLAIGSLLVTAVALSFPTPLRTALFGLDPLDPIALLIAVGFLASVTIVAAYLPARRALGIGPLAALRHD